MNKKKTIIISLITVVCVIIGIISFVLIKNNNKNNTPSNNENSNIQDNQTNENNNTTDKEMNENIIEEEIILKRPEEIENQELKDFIQSDEGKKIQKEFSKIVMEIKDKKTYVNLQKDQNGGYIGTKKDLIKMGYDLSFLDESCKDDDIIVRYNMDKDGKLLNQQVPITFKMMCK